MLKKLWSQLLSSRQPYPVFILMCVAAAFVPCTASAQQSAPTSSQSSAPSDSKTDQNGNPKPEQKHETEPKALATPIPEGTATGDKDKNAGTSNDRLFFALPNFLTVQNAGQIPPLTTGQKFRVVARGNFDYIQFFWYAFLAGIAQAENSEPGYGQGVEGYGKRILSDFADGSIENFMTGAILPSLLHQDPRFFQSGQGGFTHRTEYAVSRIFVTRTDSGKSQFNYSEIVGSALSAAISTNTYHPRAFITHRFDPTTNMVVAVHNASDRTLPNTLSVWGTQVGYDTITIVVKEFWPDVHRKLSKKHNGDAVRPASTTP